MQLVTQSATDIKQLIEYRLTDSATNTMKISSERISYKIAAGDSFDFLPLNNLGIVTTTGPTTLVLQLRLSNADAFTSVMSGMPFEHDRGTKIIAQRINLAFEGSN